MVSISSSPRLIVKGLSPLEDFGVGNEHRVAELFAEYGIVEQVKLQEPTSEDATAIAEITMQSIGDAEWLVENVNGTNLAGMDTPLEICFITEATATGGGIPAQAPNGINVRAKGASKGDHRFEPFRHKGKGPPAAQAHQRTQPSWLAGPITRLVQDNIQKCKDGVEPLSIETLIEGVYKSGDCPGDACNDERCLYVRGLPSDTTDLDLYRIFTPFGAIQPRGCVAVLESGIGAQKACKGFGFVHFLDRKDADKAIEALHGSILPNGQEFVVTASKPRQSPELWYEPRAEPLHSNPARPPGGAQGALSDGRPAGKQRPGGLAIHVPLTGKSAAGCKGKTAGSSIAAKPGAPVWIPGSTVLPNGKPVVRGPVSKGNYFPHQPASLAIAGKGKPNAGKFGSKGPHGAFVASVSVPVAPSFFGTPRAVHGSAVHPARPPVVAPLPVPRPLAVGMEAGDGEWEGMEEVEAAEAWDGVTDPGQWMG